MSVAAVDGCCKWQTWNWTQMLTFWLNKWGRFRLNYCFCFYDRHNQCHDALLCYLWMAFLWPSTWCKLISMSFVYFHTIISSYHSCTWICIHVSPSIYLCAPSFFFRVNCLCIFLINSELFVYHEFTRCTRNAFFTVYASNLNQFRFASERECNYWTLKIIAFRSTNS